MISRRKEIIVIQARTGSSRLPGKVLMPVLNRPMLQLQIELLRYYNIGDEIIVVTSNKSNDDAIEELSLKLQTNCARGSESNVFSRFLKVANQNPNSTIVRLTGDNPLIDYQVLLTAVNAYKVSEAEFASTRYIHPDRTIERWVPKGKSVDVFSSNLIEKVSKHSLDDYDKEHVIPALYRHAIRFEAIKPTQKLENAITVDDKKDYEHLQTVVAKYNTLEKIAEFCGYNQ